MSHTITGQTQFRSVEILTAACRRLGIESPRVGTHRLFDRSVEGHAVFLKGWNYPAVVDLATGQVSHDTFEGRWGDMKELDRLKQAYATESMLAALRKQGRSAIESVRQDGTIELTVAV